ncbi:hypothetical protein ACFFRR_010694 [Megaselia abdita]
MFQNVVVFTCLILAASVLAYDINTAFERILLTDYDLRSCCNDPFLKNETWIRLKYYRGQCENQFPSDKNCAIFCIITKFKEYDTIFGFHEDVILRLIGSKGLATNGTRNDWKIPIADRIVRHCLNLVDIKPHDDTLICNPDISVMGNCYWDKMLEACPDHLKNVDNC